MGSGWVYSPVAGHEGEGGYLVHFSCYFYVITYSAMGPNYTTSVNQDSSFCMFVITNQKKKNDLYCMTELEMCNDFWRCPLFSLLSHYLVQLHVIICDGRCLKTMYYIWILVK